jgi:hypothetical protein
MGYASVIGLPMVIQIQGLRPSFIQIFDLPLRRYAFKPLRRYAFTPLRR